MKSITYEQSVEAAKPIRQMAEIARTLDVKYLTTCVDQMKEQHSFRDAAMVLNPSPFTAHEQQDLNAAKIKGLELMIELAKNQEQIFDLTIKLSKAQSDISILSKMFGL